LKTNHKYMMFGIVPVVYDDVGTWEVDIAQSFCRKILTSLVLLLARLNRFVEVASMGKIEMPVPLVHQEDSLVVRLVRGRRATS